METTPRTLLNYRTVNNREPFQEWLRGLKDRDGRAKIRIRLNRVEQGNFGKHKGVGEGVIELIIDFGPGYRVYVGEDGDQVILLCGGDKSTQDSDINKAKGLWRNYNAEED